jgi:hypothetical protein
MEPRTDFVPVKLINTRKFMPKGYRICEITMADYQKRNGKPVLSIEFRVARGKYEGFKLTSTFFLTYKGRLRLTYLCNAAGITGELKYPGQLIGKMAKLRVVPYYRTYRGRRYLNHKITRFHPVG